MENKATTMIKEIEYLKSQGAKKVVWNERWPDFTDAMIELGHKIGNKRTFEFLGVKHYKHE